MNLTKKAPTESGRRQLPDSVGRKYERFRLIEVYAARLFTGHLALPCPGVFHCLVYGHFSFPAEHFVGFLRIGPDFLDIACPALTDLVGHFHARGTLEGVDELKHGEAAACAEVEDLHGLCVLLEDAPDGDHMRFGEVNNIDIVADAGTVGRVVVVAEHGELLADAGSGLCEVWHQVLGHSEGQLADASRRVGADRVEIA